MARRIPDVPKSKPSRGLLSNVFGFVSREFESFLVNATSTEPANKQSAPRAKSSRRRRRRRDPVGNTREDETNAQHHREREKSSKREMSHSKPRSKSTDSFEKHHHDSHATYNGVDDGALSAGGRKSPGHRQFLVPQPPRLRKQPSLTMPGSLFPRSPSLLPDPPDGGQVLLGGLYPHSLDETEAGPSSMHSSTIQNSDSNQLNQLSEFYVSPWRTRSVSSVKDAVNRFNASDGVEADFSLMLPSPHASPAKSISKSRSFDEVSPHRPTSSSTVSPSTSKKGKERAREIRDDDLDFIVSGSSEHGDIYAKECELDAAREEQREHERRLSGNQSRRASDERERDKRRIKALEEEVRWLKEELSRSQVRISPPRSLAPPPPPPPPPPPVPLRIDTMPCTPTSMFATARASLRHAMTPVEAPINNPIKTKRQGQPTVNVPSEKMAAFLLEIKTAKLRKVGSGTNAMGGDGIAGPSGLSKSVGVANPASTVTSKLSAKELLRRRSLASLRVPIDSSLAAPVPTSAFTASKEPEVRVGQKRKADALGMDNVAGVPSKRLMTQYLSQSSSGTSQDTVMSSSLLSSLSLPPRSLLTNETDITTPSLCSDNEREETSIEDRTPSTPPKISKTDTRAEEIEVIDTETIEDSHPPVPRRTSDLFKKRPPTSPIPFPTPRRPSAPARTKRGATPMPKSVPTPESDMEDEDEEPPCSAPVPRLSLIPTPEPKASKPKTKPTLQGKGRPRAALQQSSRLSASSGSGSSSQSKRRKVHKRRQTLDEEIRTAEAHSSDIDQCNDEQEAAEEDVFSATGTKSQRRGFLAHGGGGGAPVFMGTGYVQGAASDSGDEAEVPVPQPRKSSKQASLIPRLKARI